MRRRRSLCSVIISAAPPFCAAVPQIICLDRRIGIGNRLQNWRLSSGGLLNTRGGGDSSTSEGDGADHGSERSISSVEGGERQANPLLDSFEDEIHQIVSDYRAEVRETFQRLRNEMQENMFLQAHQDISDGEEGSEDNYDNDLQDGEMRNEREGSFRQEGYEDEYDEEEIRQTYLNIDVIEESDVQPSEEIEVIDLDKEEGMGWDIANEQPNLDELAVSPLTDIEFTDETDSETSTSLEKAKLDDKKRRISPPRKRSSAVANANATAASATSSAVSSAPERKRKRKKKSKRRRKKKVAPLSETEVVDGTRITVGRSTPIEIVSTIERTSETGQQEVVVQRRRSDLGEIITRIMTLGIVFVLLQIALQVVPNFLGAAKP